LTHDSRSGGGGEDEEAWSVEVDGGDGGGGVVIDSPAAAAVWPVLPPWLAGGAMLEAPVCLKSQWAR
jgi:hypothetical protein